jgi:hypothetical protein
MDARRRRKRTPRGGVAASILSPRCDRDARDLQRLRDKLVPLVWSREFELGDGGSPIKIGVPRDKLAAQLEEAKPNDPHRRIVRDGRGIDLYRYVEGHRPSEDDRRPQRRAGDMRRLLCADRYWAIL